MRRMFSNYQAFATVLLVTLWINQTTANVPFLIEPTRDGFGDSLASSRIAKDDFIQVNETHFYDKSGEKFRINGINYWSCMHLAADNGAGGNMTRLQSELDTLHQRGVNVIRIMAASEGAPNRQPFRVYPALQPRPGVWDERLFVGLDRCIVEAGRRGIRVLMVMGNTWQWTGGIAQLYSWAEDDHPEIPYPRAWDIHAPPQRTDGFAGWGDWVEPAPASEFMAFQQRFYTSTRAQHLFERHLRRVMRRRNTLSGLVYSDDATILAWEPLNEPQTSPHSAGVEDENKDPMIIWHRKVSALIKESAPKQLSTTGFEAKQGERIFKALHQSDAIDFTCAHLWAELWQHYDKMDTSDESLEKAKRFASTYLEDVQRWSQELKKPLLLEEFGMARDVWKNADGPYLYHTDATTAHRDAFFAHIYHIVCKSSGNASFAGLMPWSFGGTYRAQTQKTNAYGVVIAGDPPQEPPGWFSILDSDESTLAVIESCRM